MLFSNSKDLLDGEGEMVPMARPQTSGSMPSSSYGTRPTTASSLPGALEEREDLNTPTSAANYRAKMMQQKQRMLAKQQMQRSGPLGASSMVMENKGQPVSEVATPLNISRPPALPGTPGKDKEEACVQESAQQPLISAGSPTAADQNTPTAFMSDRPPLDRENSTMSRLSRMSLDEEEDPQAVVIPEAPVVVSKEEEARRRAILAQKLEDGGVCPVFDPTAGADGPIETGPTFDVSTVPIAEMGNFLNSATPKQAGMLQCRIRRDKSGLNKLYTKYVMETDAGVFLMAAQKQKQNKTSNYAISMSPSPNTNTDDCLGKLRSDLCGLEFVAYGPGLNPNKVDSKLSHAQAMQVVRQEIVAVQYTSTSWGTKSRGPRKMTTTIPKVQPNGERIKCETLRPETEGLIAMNKTGTPCDRIDTYQNRQPKWNDQIGAYVLNFNKRVTMASVKNFQLQSSDDSDSIYLQFGRVGKEVFNIDFRYPLSPFQAFAICLSSFDFKLCCD